MYQIKNRIYLNFDKTQKSAVCNYLRALVKQGVNSGEYSVENLLNKFIEDEKYYLEINASRFEFLEDLLHDNTFLADTELYIHECKKYYDYKKKQEPLRQAKKEYDKIIEERY